jgi:hypothetical protein
LDKYALNSIPNGKVLVIVELTIISTEYTKIGNPVALTQKQSTISSSSNTKQQIINNDENIEEICKCSNCQDKTTILLCYKMLGLNENASKGKKTNHKIE